MPLLLLTACSSPSESEAEEDVAVNEPIAATLVFPENNTECEEGEILSENESLVTFLWNASEHTDTYEVFLRDLTSNEVDQYPSNTNELEIRLQRGTPYSWYVVSKSIETSKEGISNTWQFYNAGPGLVNHAPFPAEVVRPTSGYRLPNETSSMVLEWSANDLGNDITHYEVYFGTNEEALDQIAQTVETKHTISVLSGQTYYWTVKTFDSTGNVSNSDIFWFAVE